MLCIFLSACAIFHLWRKEKNFKKHIDGKKMLCNRKGKQEYCLLFEIFMFHIKT